MKNIWIVRKCTILPCITITMTNIITAIVLLYFRVFFEKIVTMQYYYRMSQFKSLITYPIMISTDNVFMLPRGVSFHIIALICGSIFILAKRDPFVTWNRKLTCEDVSEQVAKKRYPENPLSRGMFKVGLRRFWETSKSIKNTLEWLH